MTGSLLASLPLSSPAPVRAVGSSYLVDSFSEFSTRTVNRAKSSPTSALGPHSARAKEEDEELFRDLFAGESEASVGYKAPAFIPQKPDTRRVPSSTNPRQHFVPVKASSPQSGLSTPYIPRLKLEELINARPDDDDEDENNGSRRSSQRGSELQQMSEEDDWCLDDRSTEGRSNKTNPRKAQVMTHARGFNSNLTNNSQRSNNSDRLEQDALRFLEKLDLKAVLHTPRPDILSFYLGTTTAPISTSTNSKARDREKKQPGGIKPRNDVILDEPLKKPRVDGAASRLAHMKSTYGTAPLVRKARRETIDRLANPISGHSSTLLALSPKQREKRRTARAPLSPISAAIAVSCRRSSTSKKAKPPGSLLSGLGTHIGDCEIPVPTPATSKRMSVKQQDPLLHKRRSTVNSSIHTRRPATGKRKSKTALGSHSLVARKEALKKKL
ncbi:hypothetical protein GN244_ATG12363 [Phytophthora infestans]|uniref:Uncharacterized protein n=1 Tax=Phytophthora infestans TaxID=4787 RepID=A0A833SN64_PHYIN|nr:hypothetical protein GN244_ATG12363 [Phytophthora infestans]KAF4135348.1 hypothetical protein GN958_ATG15470 [Phytophthora infestans]